MQRTMEPVRRGESAVRVPGSPARATPERPQRSVRSSVHSKLFWYLNLHRCPNARSLYDLDENL